jgi:hypothetical protein
MAVWEISGRLGELGMPPMGLPEVYAVGRTVGMNETDVALRSTWDTRRGEPGDGTLEEGNQATER